MDIVKEDKKLDGLRKEDRVRWRQMICCGNSEGNSQKEKEYYVVV